MFSDFVQKVVHVPAVVLAKTYETVLATEKWCKWDNNTHKMLVKVRLGVVSGAIIISFYEQLGMFAEYNEYRSREANPHCEVLNKYLAHEDDFLKKEEGCYTNIPMAILFMTELIALGVVSIQSVEALLEPNGDPKMEKTDGGFCAPNWRKYEMKLTLNWHDKNIFGEEDDLDDKSYRPMTVLEMFLLLTHGTTNPFSGRAENTSTVAFSDDHQFRVISKRITQLFERKNVTPASSLETLKLQMRKPKGGATDDNDVVAANGTAGLDQDKHDKKLKELLIGIDANFTNVEMKLPEQLVKDGKLADAARVLETIGMANAEKAYRALALMAEVQERDAKRKASFHTSTDIKEAKKTDYWPIVGRKSANDYLLESKNNVVDGFIKDATKEAKELMHARYSDTYKDDDGKIDYETMNKDRSKKPDAADGMKGVDAVPKSNSDKTRELAENYLLQGKSKKRKRES